MMVQTAVWSNDGQHFFSWVKSRKRRLMAKSHTVSFHILNWTYHSDMHIEAFKNADILETTHVCTLQGPPSGRRWKGYVIERHVILVTEVNVYFWTLLFNPHFHYFAKLLQSIVLSSNKSGDNLVITTCHLKRIGSFKYHCVCLCNWKFVPGTQTAWILI